MFKPDGFKLVNEAQDILETKLLTQKYLDEGLKDFQKRYVISAKAKARLNNVKFMKTLGEGSFGRVILVRHKLPNNKFNYYAVKVIDKKSTVIKKQVQHVMNEKRILFSIRFPFTIDLKFFYMDKASLFMGLPFINGGDMFKILEKKKSLNEYATRFYSGQIVLAFEYLHHLHILYRDLKPENVLVESSGFIKLADFGFAKLVLSGRTYTVCGTPEYFSPEMVLHGGYGKSVDWWALGALIYEIFFGTPLFKDRDKLKLYEQISKGLVIFPINNKASWELKDIIGNLLEVEPSHRIGLRRGGVNEIKQHAFYRHFDWYRLYRRKLLPPFRPEVKSESDTSNFDNFDDSKYVHHAGTGSADEDYDIYFKDF